MKVVLCATFFVMTLVGLTTFCMAEGITTTATATSLTATTNSGPIAETNTLTPRETAVIAWSALLFLYFLFKTKPRESIQKLLKAFFVRPILYGVASMLAYVTLEILLLHKIGLATRESFREIFYWTTGTAFVLLMKLHNSSNDKDFFKKILKESIRFSIFLEFVVGLYSFSLPVELMLIPATAIFSILDVFLKFRPEYNKPEYVPVKRLTKIIVIAFGLVLLGHSLKLAIQNLDEVASLKSLRAIFIVPALTLAYLPFVYLQTLKMTYENVLMRLGFFMQSNPQFRTKVRNTVLWSCNVRLGRLKKVSQSLHRFNSIQNSSELAGTMAKIFAPPKPLAPTKHSIVGHWYTNDAFTKGHRNFGTRTDYYFSMDTMREISKLSHGGVIDDSQRYTLSAINEETKLVKLTTYYSDGRIALENALQLVADGKQLRSCYMDEDSDVVDFSESQTWYYVDAQTAP